MSKMSETVGEFKFMKDDLNRRLTSLENPKVSTGCRRLSRKRDAKGTSQDRICVELDRHVTLSGA